MINKIVCLTLALAAWTAIGAAGTVTTTITLTGTNNLISLPCVPLAPSPDSVFDGFNIHNNLTSWDPANQIYNIYNSAVPETFGGALLGEGYWLTGVVGQQITYESLPSGVPTGETLTDMWISLPGKDDGQNIGGRHLVGCPYDGNVPSANIQFTNGIDVLSWPQANAAGWVGYAMSYWAGSGYNDITCDDTSVTTKLRPGKGYWVETNIDNLAMIIIAPTEYSVSRTIAANVTLNSWTATSPVTLPFQVRYRKSGTLDMPTLVNMDLVVSPNSGTGKALFALTNLDPGAYDIWVKCNHWLANKVIGIDVSASDSTGYVFVLKNADINGDNAVNFSDYLILQTQYKKSPGTPTADINGDGAVNFSDYLILQANYKKVGDVL